jgi:hypothetical protein
MSAKDNDHQSTVGNNSCSYGKLGKYNKNRAMAPSSTGGRSYSVPSWGGISYTALMHGNSCAGYATINTAYSSKCAGSGGFVSKSCM